MHDPMVVAWEIKSPIKRKHALFPEGYRSTWITVWHVDPESDGTDDSCGYTSPRLTDKQRSLLKSLAWSEAYEPWFQRLGRKRNDDPVVAEHLMRGAVELVCRVLDIEADWGEISRWACRFVQNPMDNFRGGLCHLPGYHSNFEEDRRDERESCAFGLFSGIAIQILRDRRPWWRHPKFHVHHWRVQVPFLQALKRRLSSRCAACGKRFPWGYAPVAASWSNPGPRWFRGEPGVYHHECEREATRKRRAEAEASTVGAGPP
jgi:hypothetical protein